MGLLPLTGDQSLFQRLGLLGRMLRDVNLFQKANYRSDVLNILQQFTANPLVPANFATSVAGGQTAIGTIAASLQALAQATLLTMVNAATPQPSRTDQVQALEAVIAAMQAQGATVQQCLVGLTAQATSGNTGNGVVVGSTKRGDGLSQENLYAESAILTCVADSQSGNRSAGNESFRFAGTASQANAFSPDWPAGSGSAAPLAAIDATRNNATGNLLTNSDFETWTSNTPNNWTIATGTAGSQVKQGTAPVFTGIGSLNLVGDGSTKTALTQQFNNASTGTAGKLQPATVYALSLWLTVDVVPGAGVLTVDLIDGNGNVIADQQGVQNSFSVTLSQVSGSWTNYSGVFRTPNLLPAVQNLRLRLSGALSNGRNLYIDHLAFGAASKLYNGGPFLASFSGSTPFLLNDQFTITTTNDRGGSAFNATFQTLFARWFPMMANELLLPSSLSPTIPDTLITAAGPALDFSLAANSMYLPGRP